MWRGGVTNSKSVDNYRFMTAKPFVMTNSAYCLIDGVQFVIYKIAPDLLPFGDEASTEHVLQYIVLQPNEALSEQQFISFLDHLVHKQLSCQSLHLHYLG